jgi:hypothetical protein
VIEQAIADFQSVQDNLREYSSLKPENQSQNGVLIDYCDRNTASVASLNLGAQRHEIQTGIEVRGPV